MFFGFLNIVISFPNDCSSAFDRFAPYITILPLSTRDLIAFHSLVLRLDYLKEVRISSNNSFSTLLKKISELGWPVGGFQDDLDRNVAINYEINVI